MTGERRETAGGGDDAGWHCRTTNGMLTISGMANLKAMS
jgi:hypothetical protein